MRFRRGRGGVLVAAADPVELAVLASAARDLVELLTSDAPGAGERDPLEDLVGLSAGPVAAPEDPALRRLLPDAYRPDAFAADAVDDPAAAAAAAAAEFRRYTDSDLRARKRAQADTVLETLAPAAAGEPLRLDRDQADAWLGFLTDVRLVLGVRLDVDEDTLEEGVDDDDPRADALRVYGWLGWVQEQLLSCLEPRRS